MPYRRIEDPGKLQKLLEAVLLLEADLSLPVLLRHFVEEACAMTGARYGALGVLDEERKELAEFITVGMTDEEERAIGIRPTGLGVLGLLIDDARPLRLRNIAEHPTSAGFPEGHPPMASFLGVPVCAHDEVYGNLYLTEKIGWSGFTDDDESLALALAQAAAIAIENSRLQARVGELAVFEDRERIARDLHDAVIQRLFAIGLSLQGIARPPLEGPILERVQRAISDLDATIRQIRTSIFELSNSDAERPGLRASVLTLVRELRPVVGFDASVSFEGPVETRVPEEISEHLLFTIRECLTNVGRHAMASSASVLVRVDTAFLTLEVVDNGRGIATAAWVDTTAGADAPARTHTAAGHPDAGGLGLANLRRRAERLAGEVVVSVPTEGGTSIVWRVPV